MTTRTSINVMERAWADDVITLLEAKQVEASVLQDGQVSQKERSLLKSLVANNKFTPQATSKAKEQLQWLTDSENIRQYTNYLFLNDLAAVNDLTDKQGGRIKLLRSVTAKTDNISCESKAETSDRSWLDGWCKKFDENSDKKINIADLQEWYAFSLLGDPRWKLFASFLQSKILADDEYAVHAFLTRLYKDSPNEFFALLRGANIHFEENPNLITNNPKYQAILINTFMERAFGFEELNLLIGAQAFVPDLEVILPTFDDLSIPIKIRFSTDDDPGHSAAAARNGKVLGENFVDVTILLDRAVDIPILNQLLAHEIKHAAYQQARLATDGKRLPEIVSEAFANYHDGPGQLNNLSCYPVLLPKDWGINLVTQEYIEGIANVLLDPGRAYVLDEHQDGDVFFTFVEHSYGSEKLAAFFDAFLPKQADVSKVNILELAAQQLEQLESNQTAWKKVVENFRSDALAFHQQRLEDLGRTAMDEIIQSSFALEYNKNFLLEGRIEHKVRDLSLQSRQDLKNQLAQFLIDFPESPLCDLTNYMMAAVLITEKIQSKSISSQRDLSEAKSHLKLVKKHLVLDASELLAEVYVYEGDDEAALHVIDAMMKKNPGFERARSLKKYIEEDNQALTKYFQEAFSKVSE